MNYNVEENIIASMLNYLEKQPYIFEHCKSEFFINPLNRKIYDAAYTLHLKGEEIDNVSIFMAVDNDAEVGEQLAEIITSCDTNSIFVKKYCNLLAKNYVNAVVKNANSIEDLEKIETLKANYIDCDAVNIKHISDGVENFRQNYEKRKETMIVTGYSDIDKYIGSFCGGDYIALGGATRMGKTTIALNLAKNFCCQGKKVLYCSLEMPIEQLQNRFACLTAGLNASKFRSIGFTADEMQQYEDALKTLNDWDLYVLCDYNLTTDKLKVYAQEQKKKGLDFIIIDYLGLISGYNNKALYEKSTIISRKLKLLATELNIPILVLVQLNRSLKDRADKRPILSDIRESGAIEQDADFVLFAHREYVYTNDEDQRNDLDILIAKNRHGESDVCCSLRFNLATQEITEKQYYGFPRLVK